MPIIKEIEKEEYEQGVLTFAQEHHPVLYYTYQLHSSLYKIFLLFTFEMSVLSIAFSIALLHFYSQLLIICFSSLTLSLITCFIASFIKKLFINPSTNFTTYCTNSIPELRPAELDTTCHKLKRNKSNSVSLLKVDRYDFDIDNIKPIDEDILCDIHINLRLQSIMPHSIFVECYREDLDCHPDYEPYSKVLYYHIITIATPEFERECSDILSDQYNKELHPINMLIFEYAFYYELIYLKQSFGNQESEALSIEEKQPGSLVEKWRDLENEDNSKSVMSV